jgi:hypothetical protein
MNSCENCAKLLMIISELSQLSASNINSKSENKDENKQDSSEKSSVIPELKKEPLPFDLYSPHELNIYKNENEPLKTDPLPFDPNFHLELDNSNFKCENEYLLNKEFDSTDLRKPILVNKDKFSFDIVQGEHERESEKIDALLSLQERKPFVKSEIINKESCENNEKNLETKRKQFDKELEQNGKRELIM